MVVWTPRVSERCTVACTVRIAVQGARNASSDSNTSVETHHAPVPAITVLRICSTSVMNSGR